MSSCIDCIGIKLHQVNIGVIKQDGFNVTICCIKHGNLAGKLAARYKFSSTFSLRGAISNGFRAPSIQQCFFEGIQSFRGSAHIDVKDNFECLLTG